MILQTTFLFNVLDVLRFAFLTFSGHVALGAQRPIVVKLSRESVCPVHCGKTADRIRMPFGIIGRTGPGPRNDAGSLGFGDRSTGRGTSGANLGRAIVTKGAFRAYVCYSAATRPYSQLLWADLFSLVTNILLHLSCL